MRIETDPAALQAEALVQRAAGRRIGLVPTMGYLHAGHTSLMDIARPRCDFLVVSVFVNPLQFGPGEDLAHYPRDPKGDAEKCRQAGVDLLFMPTDFYPPQRRTTVSVSGLTTGLCGADRPGHFDGVTTVVSRLLCLSQAQVAVFGEKDFQQLAVLRRMVLDLGLPVEIIGGPLVRDTDNLALSSRNRYLTAPSRLRALSLHRALFALRDAVAAHGPGMQVSALLALARAHLDVDRLDYLEVVDPHTLAPLTVVEAEARAVLAARIGPTRLLDNIALVP